MSPKASERQVTAGMWLFGTMVAGFIILLIGIWVPHDTFTFDGHEVNGTDHCYGGDKYKVNGDNYCKDTATLTADRGGTRWLVRIAGVTFMMIGGIGFSAVSRAVRRGAT